MANFRHISGGGLASAVAEDKRTALADFELSVERYLDYWVDTSMYDDNAPDVIASCIEQYIDVAKGAYGADPEDGSVMLLTIMDLWMALDKLTTQQRPLLTCLTSYSPEIPQYFLHPLLLHRSSSLRRATLIEEHILRRHQEASYTMSVFSDNAIESSFAVQYLRTSHRLRLKVEITQRALEERSQTLAELGLTERAVAVTSGFCPSFKPRLRAGYCRGIFHWRKLCQNVKWSKGPTG